MYMNDWEEKLNAFLKFTGREVLDNPGSISKEIADTLARKQYDLFEAHRRKISDDDNIEALPDLPKKNR